MINSARVSHGLSLRAKILIPIILISVLTFSLTFWLFHWYLTNKFENEIKKRVETITNTIIYSCDASSDPMQIQRLVTTLLLEKDVTGIITLAGNPPSIFASSRIQWIGKNLSEIKDLPERAFIRAAATSPGMYQYDLNEMLDDLERESTKRSQIEQQIRESEAKLQELRSISPTIPSFMPTLTWCIPSCAIWSQMPSNFPAIKKP